MAVNILPLIEPQQIANSATTYFTAQVATRVDKITVINPTATAATVTLYWVPSGGSAGDTNAIVKTRPVQSLESWDAWPFIGQVLAAGDAIAAVASATTTLNIAASGTTVS